MQQLSNSLGAISYFQQGVNSKIFENMYVYACFIRFYSKNVYIRIFIEF